MLKEGQYLFSVIIASWTHSVFQSDLHIDVLYIIIEIGIKLSVLGIGDGAGNTVEENSSIFSLIRMR